MKKNIKLDELKVKSFVIANEMAILGGLDIDEDKIFTNQEPNCAQKNTFFGC